MKQVENNIRIKLTTISGNYVKSLKEDPAAQRWTRHQDKYLMGILAPVRIG